MRIVLDTNVLVSALLTPHGSPARISDLIRQYKLKLCFDTRIMEEYEEVLKRPEFTFSNEDITTLLDFLQENGEVISSLPLIDRLPDPDDEPFLEVALSGRTDVLVTGNIKHYPAELRCGVKVTVPTEFLDHWRKNQPS